METVAWVRGHNRNRQRYLKQTGKIWVAAVPVLFLLASLASGQLYTGSISGPLLILRGGYPVSRVNAPIQDKGFAFTATPILGRYLLRRSSWKVQRICGRGQFPKPAEGSSKETSTKRFRRFFHESRCRGAGSGWQAVGRIADSGRGHGSVSGQKLYQQPAPD